MSALGRVLGVGLRAVEAVPPLARRQQRGLAVFTFHDVGDAPSPFQVRHQLTTPTGLFERQLDWITRRWTVVHPDALVERRTLPPRAALLTFDDGWAGIMGEALPRLRARRLPSVVFLTVAPMRGEPDLTAVAEGLHATGPMVLPEPSMRGALEQRAAVLDDEWLDYQGRYASWDDVLAWDGDGAVRWGSHLHRHWNVAAVDDELLIEEYRANAEVIDGLGRGSRLFAFPFGRPGAHFRPEQVDVVRRLGATRVFTSVPAVNRDAGAYVLDRMSLTPADTSEADLRRLLAAPLVARVRRLVGGDS